MQTGAFVLAEAFAEDPLMTYFWPRPGLRQHALPAFWESRIASRAETGMVDAACDADGDIVSVALWEPPGIISSIAKPFTLFRALKGSLPRALAASRQIEDVRPDTPHLYLAAVGTHPNCRRQGFASSLIEQRLAGSTEPCFLISNSRAACPFFERFGFKRHGELSLDHGPIVYPMLLSR
ncbi:GNAT family N-acetyltransferase [Nocardia suismassiliense]|uniref:GNAT family N-acetyltransferase n=1 Tax=Nocardia suismassiliense TaxID=2077092 RepID=A0ABW6QQV2_9NOCA